MGVMGRHSEIQIKKELEGTTGGKKPEKTTKEMQSRSNSCKVKQNMLGANKDITSLTNQNTEKSQNCI